MPNPSMTPNWTSLVLAHLRKDLQIEWRSRDAINSMLFFALLVVVLFSMAFDPTRATSREIAGGVLCVATLFASVSALNQAWAREIRHQVLDALRMTPSGGAAMFLQLAIVIPLGTWALVSNGTFFAALSIRSRNREMLLPLILFPIFLPALLAMVLSVKTILTGDGSDPSLLWIKVLAGYDIIFTTISLLLFSTVIEAE